MLNINEITEFCSEVIRMFIWRSCSSHNEEDARIIVSWELQVVSWELLVVSLELLVVSWEL